MTTKDLRKLYSVDRRTITRWVRAGCPHESTAKGNEFDPDAVAAWIESDLPGGDQYAISPDGTPSPAPARLPAPAGKIPSKPPAEAGPGQLLNILARLESSEVSAHATWQEAAEAHRVAIARNEKPLHSAAALNQLQKSWNDLVQTRRAWEKDLPSILTDRGRYVDTRKVASAITLGATATATASRAIGLRASDAIVAAFATAEGDPPGVREVAAIIDAESDNVFRHLAKVFAQFANKKTGDE